MKKKWIVSPVGTELRLVCDDGFKERVIPYTETELLLALNQYEEQIERLLKDLD